MDGDGKIGSEFKIFSYLHVHSIEFELTLFTALLVADPGRLLDLAAYEATLLATEGGLWGNLQLC